MLKFLLQPEHASRGWVATVLEQQRELNSMLTGTPSLKTYTPKLFANAYPHAVKSAAAETGIPRAKFPAECPWTLDDVLTFEPPEVS
jgi:hypothetical protein